MLGMEHRAAGSRLDRQRDRQSQGDAAIDFGVEPAVTRHLQPFSGSSRAKTGASRKDQLERTGPLKGPTRVELRKGAGKVAQSVADHKVTSVWDELGEESGQVGENEKDIFCF